MGGLITWSTDRSERDVQRYGLAFLGWLLLSVLVVGIPAAVQAADSSAGEHRTLGLVPLRIALGAIAVAIALWLPLLLRKHTRTIAAEPTVRGQWRNMALVTLIVSVPAVIFWWWVAFAAAAVGGLAFLVLVLRAPQRGPQPSPGQRL